MTTERWRELRSAIRTELYLAERNYGVKLDPRRHMDLIQQNMGKVNVLSKLLKEDKPMAKKSATAAPTAADRIKELQAENQVLRDRLAEVEQKIKDLSVKLDKLF